MSLLYDVTLGLGCLIMALKILLRRHRPNLRDRLGLDIPDPQNRPVIWIHAVSVGEVKASQPLFQTLRKDRPDAFFLITTTTATGQEEAKRSLPQADAYRFLPLDFSWIMKRWAKTLKPEQLLFIETDIWYHLLYFVKKRGGRAALVSGKMSEKSAARFSTFKSLAHRLFDLFDLIIVQNEEHKRRFEPLTHSPIEIGGNLKFDLKPQTVALEHSFGSGPWITLSCTHDPEEELLLPLLQPLLTRYRLFLAPRHPERSDAMEKLLQKLPISYSRWNSPDSTSRVILVDRLGQLPLCYSLSVAALVGGSYTPRIGGHNVLEPCLYRCPSFFGPHMHAQREIAQILQQGGAGHILELSDIAPHFERLLEPSFREGYAKQATAILTSVQGATDKTIALLTQ